MTFTLAALLAAPLLGGSVYGQEQSEIARMLGSGPRVEQARAAVAARMIDPADITPGLRIALIRALEREGELNQKRRRNEVGFLEQPLLLAQLAEVVVMLRDPRAIPGLVGALMMSPISSDALADFGDQAVPHLVDAITGLDDPGPEILTGALLSLRLMLERHDRNPLSPESFALIRKAAEARLTGRQSVTVLWHAIILALVLRDPELRTIVEAIANDADEIRARGIEAPDMIADTQRRAREGLEHGIDPLGPPWGVWPP